MTEQLNGADLSVSSDPKNIDPNKVKAYAMVHKISPVDAYRIMLSTDLLKRIDMSNSDTQMKIVMRVLVSSVIGEGEKDVGH